MGRNIIQTNLLQCRSCGEIFEASPKAFRREDFLAKSLPDLRLSEICQKCLIFSHANQMKHLGDTFQNILMYCKNRNYGCTTELPSCDLTAHETCCEFRPVRCIWHLQCEQKEISFCNYRKHLETMHKPYIKKVHLNEECELVIKTLKDHVVSVSSVICDEKKQFYFIRKCSADLHKNLFMVCVHYIGSRSDARKFIYKVKIHQGIDSLNTFYEYSAYCSPCVEIQNLSEAHSNCIVLNPKKLFLTNDYQSELRYSVTIKRVRDNIDA